MKKIIFLFLTLFFNLSSISAQDNQQYCLTGAFLADNPSQEDILKFKNAFGKKPYLVMVFLDWGDFPDKKVIADVYGQNCALIVTWEPWDTRTKEGIDFDGLVSGKFDSYIREFALRLKRIKKPVFLRFAHEPNGNWYPWRGEKIGKDKYIALYRRIHDIFREVGAANVNWVFCVNWEDVPKDNNSFLLYYPGNDYVDYIGLDGYNWGDTQSWSRWMSFSELFSRRYKEINQAFNKPILITEFSSVSRGGDKGSWIRQAFSEIRGMDKIRGFVIFNVNKEGDWGFKEGTLAGAALKDSLGDGYFRETRYNNKHEQPK